MTVKRKSRASNCHEVCLSEKVIGSGAHTRVSENRCERSQLKNLCCGKHEKRILTEVGRYAGDAIRDNFTSHPSFSVLTLRLLMSYIYIYIYIYIYMTLVV